MFFARPTAVTSGRRHAFDSPPPVTHTVTHRVKRKVLRRNDGAGFAARAGRLLLGCGVAAVPFGLAFVIAADAVVRPVGPLLTAAVFAEGTAYPLPEVLTSGDRPHVTPRTVEELLAIEARTLEVARTGVAATVGLQVRGGQGSGVLISPEGLVLTAAHVSGRAGVACEIVLSDGTTLRGRTLGRVSSLDAGLAVVDDPDAPYPLPYAPLGTSMDVPVGAWTVATGHPGGYEAGRPPVVRVGRVNVARDNILQSDNTLVGGDSGGPLFDLDGRVIGIHSRIGNSMASNVHVPVDQFVARWSALASGHDDGRSGPAWMLPNAVDDGVRLDLGTGRLDSGRADGAGDARGDDSRAGATVRVVVPGSAADAAGIRPGDRIVRVGPSEITNEADMLLRRSTLRPDTVLSYHVVRAGAPLSVEVDLSRAGADDVPPGRDAPSYAGVLGIGDPFDAGGLGVGIRTVTPDGPAARAGIRAGEAVVALRGVRVNGWGEIIRLMIHMRSGDAIAVRVRSPDNTEREVDVVLVGRQDLYPNE